MIERSGETRKVEITPLIEQLGILIAVGVLLWVVNRFIPMQSQIKSILNVVVGRGGGNVAVEGFRDVALPCQFPRR